MKDCHLWLQFVHGWSQKCVWLPVWASWSVKCFFELLRPEVDFIKQFMACAWNLHSASILFAQIYSNLASCISTLISIYYNYSQIWVCSMLPVWGHTSKCSVAENVYCINCKKLFDIKKDWPSTINTIQNLQHPCFGCLWERVSFKCFVCLSPKASIPLL
jgi:hypothetical protein